MKRWARLLTLWFIMGALYYVLEGLWRIPQGGYANIVMLPIGGLCGIAVGSINQIPRFYRLPVILQSLIGAAMVLAVELAAGIILNVWLGLGIWDYSGLPWNLLGQICLPFALLWLLLMPFAIWLEDTLRWGFGWNGRRYSLWSIYKEFFTFK